MTAAEPSELPARNHVTAGGLSRAELAGLLGALLADARVIALSVAGYNPEKDADRSSARRLVELLAGALGRRVPGYVEAGGGVSRSS